MPSNARSCPRVPTFNLETVTEEQLEDALSRGYIEIRREGPKVRCSTCLAIDRKLRVCKRCQRTCYCSRECQKIHWPNHKSACNPVDRSNPFKLLRNLAQHPTIMHVLETAIALDLDLAKDLNREIGFEFPFTAIVDVGVEPIDINILMLLLLTNLPVPEKIDGVVQIHAVHCGIPGRNMPPVDIGPWRGARELANNTGSRHLPMGLWNFFLNGVGPFTLVGRPLHTDALEYARKRQPPLAVSGSLHKGKANKKEDEFSVATCLSFINSHIRDDTENQLKLRTTLTKSDIATIKYVTNESVNTEEVVAFRERVARVMAPILGLT